MLREFPMNSMSSVLVQADGRQLPFRDGSFDLVLLMHVLSGAEDWQSILNEARRVLVPGGSVAVGQTVNPESGIDTQLKRQLTVILDRMQIVRHRPQESRNHALSRLQSLAVRNVHCQAASWSVKTTPSDFLIRHRTGARFAALPADVQEHALNRLSTWAEMTFGSLVAEFQEQRSFELDIFSFAEGAG
jgi:SAM-dependent methyltransferase